MDLTCTIPTSTPTKPPDSDNDTPPHTQQPLKPLSFHNHHRQPPHAVEAATYKECLKNHAATIGGHALDGCGEFMPNSGDPTTALKCAACGCHRNFHRRESESSSPPPTTHFIDFRHHALPPIRRFSPSPSPSPPPPTTAAPAHPSAGYGSAPNMLLALSTSADNQHHHHHHHHVATPVTPTGVKTEYPSGRKRFRTRFTPNQKEKMHSFSEKLGWKMQKCDESMVDEFCNEVGVSKGVLRVWMHNNKNTFGKKDLQNADNNNNNNNSNSHDNLNNGGDSFDNNNGGHTHCHNESTTSALQLHISTNGSSSSS